MPVFVCPQTYGSSSIEHELNSCDNHICRICDVSYLQYIFSIYNLSQFPENPLVYQFYSWVCYSHYLITIVLGSHSKKYQISQFTEMYILFQIMLNKPVIALLPLKQKLFFFTEDSINFSIELYSAENIRNIQ